MGLPWVGGRELEESAFIPERGEFGAEIGTELVASIAHELLQRVEGFDSVNRLLSYKGLEAGEQTRNILISSHTLLTLALLVMPDARVVLGETVVK